MIRELKDFLFSPDVLPYLLALFAFFLFTVKYWKIDLRKQSTDIGAGVFRKLIALGVENHRKRVQLEQIGVKQNKYKRAYRSILKNVIEAYELRITVEHFTIFLMSLWVLFLALLVWIIEDIFLSVLIATPAIVALFALIVTSAKERIRHRDNIVMDFLDVVCPLIRRGVTATFERNLDAASPHIRGHIQTYINQRKFSTITVDKAMDDLAEKLGPRFYEFARKAKVFEQNAREGDAESFMDIVEMNKLIRTFDLRADALFERKKQDMLGRIAIIIVVAIYANYFGISAEFMKETAFGLVVNCLVVVACLTIYAGSQLVQITAKVADEEESSMGGKG
ncbi:hypothetical protein [Paenibacillus turpanensis]|uniref:hypothetical protein n=1 Tax=Paenibacillus turpanensis TaxID=2689078 RepID=UPI00140C1290|nr:hypothetical protein [Paenibacillus turpanensis]